MLTQLRVDNYKCFVNFECQLRSRQLFLGLNGTGKTTVFDLLEILRDFVCHGRTSTEAFPTDTLTAWDQRNEQAFELTVDGNGGQYFYRLVIEQDRQGRRNRIQSERLLFDRNPLYEFADGEAHLFRDDFSAGPTFPFDWSRSAIATIPERRDNLRLIWFRNRLSNVYVFSPDPLRMNARSEAERARPDRALHEMVSWLRHLSQEYVDTVPHLRDHLRDEVIEGLVNMRLERVSETTRTLKFDFDYGFNGHSQPFTLPLDALSTGQRGLVALFAILHAAFARDTTVCIDEPDNYVALFELQPWLSAVSDRVEEAGSQCLLISHHPEVINYLAPADGLRFHRDQTGPVRADRFEYRGDEPLTAAEIMARGWE